MLYDVVVLGAGLVGLTEALLCAKQGLSVALIDRNSAPQQTLSDVYDPRCFAISQGSQAIFESLNVWEQMEAHRVSAFDQMKVWEAQGYGEIHFQASEVNEPSLGYIIENYVMVKALWEAVQTQAQITIFMERVLNHFVKQENHLVLQLDDERCFATKVLIGADGANSWLRQAAGFKLQTWDYQQKAIVTVVQTERPHEKTAWQRFLKTGPLAFLPLKDPFLSSIVWTTTPEQADQLLQFSENEFCEALSVAFAYQLGEVLHSGQRQSFSLRAQQTDKIVDERMALIGDAAHVIHPLAGQGVNLGLQDAQVLSEILGWAKANAYDIGHYLVLRRYERARKAPVKLYSSAVDFFQRFFSVPYFPVSLLRSVGVNLVDNSPWLKKQIVLQAMSVSKSL